MWNDKTHVSECAGTHFNIFKSRTPLFKKSSENRIKDIYVHECPLFQKGKNGGVCDIDFHCMLSNSNINEMIKRNQ